MAMISITPWHNQDELIEVRGWLYAEGEYETRRKACSQIRAWKLRGGLPHAVESTWYITDAILTDSVQIKSISALSKRLCYSVAICRFVTGMLDSQQDGTYKRSMYDVAKELDLPASFVELRHEAIHGELPSLIASRQAAERALRWLWDHYWRHLDEDSLNEPNPPDVNEIKDILQAHVAECRNVLNASKNREEKIPWQQFASTAASLMEICKARQRALAEVVKALVVGAMLIPTNTGAQSMMEGVCIIWDQLLKQLTAQQGQFLRLLTNEMTAQLVAPHHGQSANDAVREGVSMWLEHIYTSSFWHLAAKRSRLEDSAIISTCLQNPNQWTVRLASSITQRSRHEQIRQLFGPLVAKALGDVNDGTRVAEERIDAARIRSACDFDGWQKLQRGWTSKGIRNT
ncbi:MAG: hypothetical protein LQ344_003393 [Seirophora lacunosa]|nr:MAG: hypothetical protein LQ344_003393 [Seirophora lacunosa]